MQFVDGFYKTASVFDAFRSGLKASGKASVSDALKLQEFRHIQNAARKHDGFAQAIQTKAGRRALAEGVGKAAPSIAVAGVGAYGARKLYKRYHARRQAPMGGADPYQPYGQY